MQMTCVSHFKEGELGASLAGEHLADPLAADIVEAVRHDEHCRLACVLFATQGAHLARPILDGHPLGVEFVPGIHAEEFVPHGEDFLSRLHPRWWSHAGLEYPFAGEFVKMEHRQEGVAVHFHHFASGSCALRVNCP